MLYNLRFILKMAIPIMLSYFAVGLMNIVDTIVVGNYDTKQLAYLGLANTVMAQDLFITIKNSILNH